MDPIAEWIAGHVPLLCVLLPTLTLLGGGLAWQYNARWQCRADRLGRAPTVLRWQVGVIVLSILVLFFCAIALALFVQHPSALASFNGSLAESLHDQLSLPALRVLAVITPVGDTGSVAALAIAVLLVLLVRRHTRLALGRTVTVLGILPINESLKALFRRVRPPHHHGFMIEPGWSFPSGRAFGAMVYYGMLADVMLRLLPGLHRAIIAAAILLIGMVGISRILLQVHYFNDVLAGYTAGAAWLVLCIAVTEALRERERRVSP